MVRSRGQAGRSSRQGESRKGAGEEQETPAAATGRTDAERTPPTGARPRAGRPPSDSTAVPTSTGERIKRGPLGAAFEWLMMLMLVSYVSFGVNVFQSHILPAPLSEQEAGLLGFSEGRAMEHVSALVKFGPHPVGTEALHRAVEYVHLELLEIKETANAYADVEIDYFQPNPGVARLVGGRFYGKSLVYSNLKYVVVRISPEDLPEAKENALLVSSHIDTVITSAGAGDCSSCVATMLELVRTLSQWAQSFKHSIIFLFNTGEEEGLIGAHSFITQHPWTATVRAAIDVESMGTGGRSTLFQAGPDRWLLDLYASVAKYPAAQIIAQDVFHSGLVKSATDFQVFRETGGLSGLDFGFTENGAGYHTKNDNIGFLRPGSLQHIGEDLFALLQAAALSDGLSSVRTNSSASEAMSMVYFDILGKWMTTYPKSNFRINQYSLISQGFLIFFSSVFLAGFSAFVEFALSLLTLAFTWIFAFIYVIVVATVLPHMNPFAVPYIAHPWLVIGLFGAPALFGALIGHALGRSILMKYLKKRVESEKEGEWHAERLMFQAGIFQWLALLTAGTFADVASSYLTLFWIVPPALAYGLRESQLFVKKQARGLLRGTLWFSMALGVCFSAVPVIRLTTVLIGNLVRSDGNPGGLPLWAGNVLVGGLIAVYTCLMLVYLLPFAHRSGGLAWILVGLSAIFFGTLLLVMTQVAPAFTEDIGRGINMVHVVDTTGSGAGNPQHYISLSAVTPGKFDEEMKHLKEDGFICGPSAIDFVSFNVKYGCKKLLEDDEALSRGRPTLEIEKDSFIDEQRVTNVRLKTGSAYRWNLAINTTAVESFILESVIGTAGERKVLVPGGAIAGVDNWHNVQFATDLDGPTDFHLTLLWQPSFDEETDLKWCLEASVLKLRTDVNLVTEELDEVLKKLPVWCVEFGKSTAPYPLAYLADLKAPLFSSS